MSLILFVLYIFHLLSSGDGKYVFNHIINTTYVSELELYNIMKSSAYFTQYLNEVKAENIQFVPAIHDEYLNDTQIISYDTVPKLRWLSVNLPKMNIIQEWNVYPYIFVGNIRCKYIGYNLTIEIKRNYINVIGEIYQKQFFVPDTALDYTIMDYDIIFNRILTRYINDRQ